MKVVLNKLTIAKFDALYNQLVSCGIHIEGHIHLLIEEILEKARTQHHFIDMYSDLCAKLNSFCQRVIVNRSANQFQEASADSMSGCL